MLEPLAADCLISDTTKGVIVIMYNACNIHGLDKSFCQTSREERRLAFPTPRLPLPHGMTDGMWKNDTVV